MKITNAYCAYEPEKFKHAFGFKGSTLSGVWQTVVALKSGGEIGVGLGIQSVLWSDSSVFAEFGEQRGNELMFAVTQHAVKLIEGKDFEKVPDIVHFVFEDCYEYAKKIVGRDNITETFVLNALVPLDMAAWQLYARLGGTVDFDGIYKGHAKAEKLANVPLISYGVPAADVEKMAKDGVCLFKIKIGSDPEGDGDLDKMLAWDKARALEIHNVLKDIRTPYTESGRVVYYFDANGRYDTKERLCDLISFFEKEGILEQTILFEEPFAPYNEIYVGDLPVCFAADESAHSLKDVKRRIELGFKAVTLKPIAKTPSVTIEMANAVDEAGVQCFCADLTVNPLMVEWNKNFAARLKPLRGMKIGVVESNGAQNYSNWDIMKTYVPRKSTESDATVYTLDSEFYTAGGGLFEIPEHYLGLIKAQNPQF